MPRYFAFLRAINVGGHIVKMERLRELFLSLDFSNVETFIASGNVIFESRSKNTKALKNAIETKLGTSLGYEVATFLRTDKELAEVAAYEPFEEALVKSAATINIGFVEEPLSADVEKALMALGNDVDVFHTFKREVYWLSRLTQRESKFSNAVFERLLKGKATFRGRNTISRMANKYLTK